MRFSTGDFLAARLARAYTRCEFENFRGACDASGNYPGVYCFASCGEDVWAIVHDSCSSAHLQQRCCADPSEEMPGLPSARGSGTLSIANLRTSAPVGDGNESRSTKRQNAAVVRRSALRKIFEQHGIKCG